MFLKFHYYNRLLFKHATACPEHLFVGDICGYNVELHYNIKLCNELVSCYRLRSDSVWLNAFKDPHAPVCIRAWSVAAFSTARIMYAQGLDSILFFSKRLKLSKVTSTICY